MAFAIPTAAATIITAISITTTNSMKFMTINFKFRNDFRIFGRKFKQKIHRKGNFLGEISYPLYLTHYPLMYLQMNWALSHPEMPLYAHIVTGAGVFVLSIFLAWACLKLYDLPVRNWLKEHWLMKKH